MEGESNFCRFSGSSDTYARGDDACLDAVVPRILKKRIGVGVSKISFGSSERDGDLREQSSEDCGAGFGFGPSFA